MTWEQQRVSFGSNAGNYDSRRPDWPAGTARWLTGTETGSGREDAKLEVLDLGAGTGKLTETLAGLGHTVTAVDPDAGMLAVLAQKVLAQKLPQVRVLEAGAEQIPLPDGSVDVVTVAQAWHWLKQPEAALEIARILRPGGQLAVAWHNRDLQVPWVAELNALAGVPGWANGLNATAVEPGAENAGRDGQTQIELPEEFGPVEHTTFAYTLRMPTAALADLVSSWSYVATRPDRDEVLKKVEQLGERVAAEEGNPAEIGLPHRTECYRAVRRH
jgi:ubiquinone/menaquinone biosynthesis C-methylase UbiE